MALRAGRGSWLRPSHPPIRVARASRRVARGVAPPGPHRPGRAVFPHPVLQVADSLWSGLVRGLDPHPPSLSGHSVRGLVGSMPLPPAFPAGSAAWPPSFLRGHPEVRFPPLRRSYWEATTPSPSIPGTSVAPRASVPLVRSLFAPLAGKRTGGGQGLWFRVPLPGSSNGDVGSPRFLENPCMGAVFSDPGRAFASRHDDASVLSPCNTRAATPTNRTVSRLNVRLPHSLSTLRGRIAADSRKTRFRLLARRCRAGFFLPPGSTERFPFLTSPFPRLRLARRARVRVR
jgi:hypothetical protein